MDATQTDDMDAGTMPALAPISVQLACHAQRPPHPRITSLALALALAASPTFAQSAKTIHAVFACDGGKRVDATFVNGAQSSVRLKLSDGRALTLPQAMSGSGARYANRDESFVFWNKGNTAFIEENGKTTYDGCVTKP